MVKYYERYLNDTIWAAKFVWQILNVKFCIKNLVNWNFCNKKTVVLGWVGIKRLDSNIESKSLKNTFLNIIELFLKGTPLTSLLIHANPWIPVHTDVRMRCPLHKNFINRYLTPYSSLSNRQMLSNYWVVIATRDTCSSLVYS